MALHQETAVLRHEWKNQLSALRLLAESGDAGALRARLDELSGMLDRLDPRQYTEHRAINAILQNAAAQAARQQVSFRCSALVPAGLKLDEATSARCSSTCSTTPSKPLRACRSRAGAR